jgi:uncharacterized protein with HEPN domain
MSERECIDNDILWNIIEQDIPALLPLLHSLKGRFS